MGIGTLLKGDKLRENLDLDTINERISEIESRIYYAARDLYVGGTKTSSLEEIIDQRKTALEEYKQDRSFLKNKKEYEELLIIKKKLETKRDNKRQEILENLTQNPDIKKIPLKGLINGITYNGLHNREIDTLGDIMDFITNNRKNLDEPKRQTSLMDRAKQVGKKGIKEIEELLKKYNIETE